MIIDGSSYRRITYPVFQMLKHHHKFCFASKIDELYAVSGKDFNKRALSEDEARDALKEHFSAMTAEIVMRQLAETDMTEFIDLNA